MRPTWALKLEGSSRHRLIHVKKNATTGGLHVEKDFLPNYYRSRLHSCLFSWSGFEITMHSFVF